MRHYIQLAFIALTNGYMKGFFQGTIYQGDSKQICVPGLNCYSCPGALGSCPVGAVQAMLTGANKSIPYYALGFLMLFGVLLGRGVCAFLCPFGFVQDMIYKIRPKKMKFKLKLPKVFRIMPYVVLVVFVIVLPLTLTNQFNISAPTFCKWICPSGTLMGGIPLLSSNESLQDSIGELFFVKLSILIVMLIWSFFEYRPFCKYVCPLGAFYGMFQSVSVYRMKYDKNACIGCNKCTKTCNMGVNVTATPNSPLCVRCGDCVRACPKNAICFTGCPQKPIPKPTDLPPTDLPQSTSL